MNRRYIDTFRDEAAELLQELEIALLQLERDADRATGIDLAFRILHTLKGSGAMAGFTRTAALAHDLEAIFDLLRSGRLAVDRPLISTALQALDQLQATIAADLAGTPPDAVPLAAVTQRIHALLPRGDERRPTPPAALVDADESLYLVRFAPAGDLFLRGLDPAGVLELLADLGPLQVVARQHGIPPLGTLDPEACHLFWDILLQTAAGEGAIRDIFIFVEGEGELAIQPLPLPPGVAPAAGRATLGEFLGDGGNLPFPHLATLLADVLARGGAATPEAGAAANDSGRALSARAASIRVQSERLDRLVNLIGELVTIQARLSQTIGGRKDAALDALAEEIERLTWDLRDEVLCIRMLPIGSIFGRLRRLVRDVAEHLGKEVEFVTRGDETELDKTVIERLVEPLMHLLRNALDHGIEPAADRRSAGKTAGGTIEISAVHSGAQVVIQVRDDGRGLDRDRLLRRAVELKLCDGEQPLGDREVQQLIFTPGFTTAREVTSISGRGVGMDAVRSAVEELRGSIEVTSSRGAGTTFTIRLPLTLAIIDGLLVRVGSEHYVIPLAAVEECIELARGVLPFGDSRPLFSLRGDLVPYLRLRDEFAVGGDRARIEQIVVTCCDGVRTGLVVDKVIGGHQTVIKPLGRLADRSRAFSGATILGSGQVALILDVPQLVAPHLSAALLPTGT